MDDLRYSFRALTRSAWHFLCTNKKPGGFFLIYSRCSQINSEHNERLFLFYAPFLPAVDHSETISRIALIAVFVHCVLVRFFLGCSAFLSGFIRKAECVCSLIGNFISLRRTFSKTTTEGNSKKHAHKRRASCCRGIFNTALSAVYFKTAF